MIGLVVAVAAFSVWTYLLTARGGFWRASVADDAGLREPTKWPTVTAVVPARDEAKTIGACVGSLLRQDYPGLLRVIIVDDQSRDSTAEIATRAATQAGAADRLEVVAGRPLPAGWAGKVWAMSQGVERAATNGPSPDYILFTDADIAHDPGALRRLVMRAEAGGFVLTSLMVKLRCESLAERALIPAFVFFFQMLYPFAWVNRRENPTAAAAGGCMLVQSDALYAAGGIGVIRSALIDDCALGQRMKKFGPIWLGLTERARSLRPYPSFHDIRRMTVRSAYDQLRYSPLLLLGTVAGLLLTYLAAPALALFGTGMTQAVAALTWILIAFAFQPMLRFYHRSPLWGGALPAIALVYMGFTIESALQHVRGRGGQWKGRVQANAARPQ